MSKVPVSVCIIAKDEEKHIGECLKRLVKYGFEIVVTDTGSTDNTVEIARRYADKVLEFEWIDDFSAARNFCVSNASNNWILILDCDEYVNDIDIKTLRIYMQKFPRNTGVMRLKSLSYDRNGNEQFGVDEVTRFYNRNYYRYEKPIHEQIMPIKSMDEGIMTKVFLLPMEVIHHGYALSEEDMKKKQQRNLDMLQKSLEKEPDSPYLLFQMGQSEIVLKNYDSAIEYLERALSLNPSTEYVYVEMLIIALEKAYIETGRKKDALDLVNKYADKCKTAKFVFNQAGVYADNDQPLKALLCYVKATMMPDVETLGDNLRDCYASIITLYHNMGNDEMAKIFIEKYEECDKEKERVINA